MNTVPSPNKFFEYIGIAGRAPIRAYDITAHCGRTILRVEREETFPTMHKAMALCEEMNCGKV